MAENKTRPETTDVDGFLDSVDPKRRDDARALCRLLTEVSGERPVMWGTSIVGFGHYHYRYATGREGDTFLVGLASQKNYISVYVQCTDDGAYLAERFKERLPKANIGKSCVRFRRTSDIDLDELRELIAQAGRIGPPAST